ncbi:MAG: 2-hydroxyacid dehydrogenase [Alphaproteobacteria bacterium]|nr:2-hydroxyacid dehydrogenase [Alphaproteobacteria bacterium]
MTVGTADSRPLIIAGNPQIAAFIAPALPECEVVGCPPEGPGGLGAAAREARVLIAFSDFRIDAALVEALPALGLVQMVGAGFDGVDPDMLRARGVALANSGDANSTVVADQALALALALSRQVGAADAWVREGQWAARGRFRLLRTLSEERAGIVGLGAIGKAIANRLAGFGTPVSWWGPREKPGEPLPRAASLMALAEQSSLLIIACPGGPATDGMIDRAVIEAVGPQGMIVNIGRGSVIDEDALIAALTDGRLGGAGLDVFATEPTPAERWASVPNVVLSPHHGGGSLGSISRMRDAVAANVRAFIAGAPLANRIA